MKATYTIHIISLGNSATKAAYKLQQSGFEARYTAACSGNDIDIPHGATHHSTLTNGLRKVIDQLHIALHDHNEQKIYIVSLGGTTSTCLLHIFFMNIDKYAKGSHIIATYPFTFEGENPTYRARTLRDEITSWPRFHAIHLEDIRKTRGNITVAEAFDLADTLIADKAREITDVSGK